ncbi:MAG: metallophosphoesterase [Bacteroidia bacterium]|nr:metallophosphoesterase [Bacteroidia bacterium]
MKNNRFPLHFIGLIVIGLLFITSCKKNDIILDPFNNDTNIRNLIVVISDIHLGANISYAEIDENRNSLNIMLEKIRTSRNVKELVIAGDLLDEWFVPATTDTYDGKDQSDFVQQIAATNSETIGKFNQIIQEGKILVTYVPGNHDLAISAENVNLILPGINQARDAAGLGTYSPVGYPEIAIEHGHRYNIIVSPDPISNRDIAPGSILPVGYFFTRLAVQHVMQGCTQNTDDIPLVTPNTAGDLSQELLYGYWQNWAWWLNMFPIENHFNEKMIVTNIDGFTETFSVNDFLPYQDIQGGEIKVNYYNGIQDTWEERCTDNNVDVNISAADAFKYAASPTGTDTMAVIQYFSNPNSTKRIVIFGHTHVSKIKTYNNYNGQKSIYANSGTWIDENHNGSTMDFILVSPQSDNTDSQTLVTLYNFANELITEISKDSLKL